MDMDDGDFDETPAAKKRETPLKPDWEALTLWQRRMWRASGTVCRHTWLTLSPEARLANTAKSSGRPPNTFT